MVTYTVIFSVCFFLVLVDNLWFALRTNQWHLMASCWHYFLLVSISSIQWLPSDLSLGSYFDFAISEPTEKWDHLQVLLCLVNHTVSCQKANENWFRGHILGATQDVTVTHFSPSTLEKETLFNAGKKNNNPFLSGLNTSLPEHGATPGATASDNYANAVEQMINRGTTNGNSRCGHWNFFYPTLSNLRESCCWYWVRYNYVFWFFLDLFFSGISLSLFLDYAWVFRVFSQCPKKPCGMYAISPKTIL